MKLHFSLLEQIKKKDINEIGLNNDFIAGYVVHTGDFASWCIDFEYYFDWMRFITQEFEDQYWAEKEKQNIENQFLKYVNVEKLIQG